MAPFRSLVAVASVIALSGGLTAVVPGATQTALAATTCSLSTHCYLLTSYGTLKSGASKVPTNTVGADLYVDCLSVPNRKTDFIDWEVWTETNSDSSELNWVEEGMTAGTIHDVNSGKNYVGFEWFWADNRPGNNYNEHYVKPATVGTTSNVTIAWQGGPNWGVILDKQNLGTSLNNGDNAWGGEAGLESTTSAVGTTIQGTLKNYQYEDPSHNWHWVPGGFTINKVPSGWIKTSSSASRSTAVSTYCGSGAAKKLDSMRAPASPIDTRSPDSALSALVTASANRFGEKDPKSISYTTATRNKAVKLSNAEVSSGAASYVVQVHGKFTGFGAHVPEGKPLPKGNVLTLVIDKKLGRVTDLSLTEKSSSLPSLGKVTKLSV